MLFLGFNDKQKVDIVNDYVRKNHIKKVYIFHLFDINYFDSIEAPEKELVGWEDSVAFEVYYRLCSEMNAHSLMVLDDFVGSSQRNFLQYNWAKLYQARGTQNICFATFPIVEKLENIITLCELSQGLNFKGLHLDEITVPPVIEVNKQKRVINKHHLTANLSTVKKYEKRRAELFQEAEEKYDFDIDNIPRRLILTGSKQRLENSSPDKFTLVGRTKPAINFKSLKDRGAFQVVDPPIHYKDFLRLMILSDSEVINWISLDFGVDEFYFERYQGIIEQMEAAYEWLEAKI